MDNIKTINDILTMYLELPNDAQELVRKIIISTNKTKPTPLNPISRPYSDTEKAIPHEAWRKLFERDFPGTRSPLLAGETTP